MQSVQSHSVPYDWFNDQLSLLESFNNFELGGPIYIFLYWIPQIMEPVLIMEYSIVTNKT